MKSFFSKNYHLVLLGVAALAVVGSVIWLFLQSGDLKTSLTPISTPASKADASTATNAVEALDRLTNPVLWTQRPKGASPLVSRPYILKEGHLIDPMEGSEPLYPPVPNQWLVDHQLDYSDMGILEKDPLGKGFTVLQEYQAGTDPTDPNHFPPLHTRLGFASGDVHKTTYVLEYMGEETMDGSKEYQLRPVQPLPNPERGGKPDTSTRGVKVGSTIPGAPFLKVVGSRENKKMINDTEYDASELLLENTVTGEQIALTKKFASKEYKPKPIELVDSVTFHYQLAGVPEETFTAERGKEVNLHTRNDKHHHVYRFTDFNQDGAMLQLVEVDGKKDDPLVRSSKPVLVKPSDSNAPSQILP
jgi:hypothetical protein